MDNAFLQSLFVQPPVVMGVQLLPFSCYHMAALMLLDSPLSPHVSTDDIGEDDLALAVLVCSQDSVDGPTTIFPDLNTDAYEEILAGDYDIMEAVAGFFQYLEDYLTFPQIWQPDDPGSGSTDTTGIPVPYHLVATVLQHTTGISEQEAWDMPISRLVGYKCAIAEENGWKVVSQRDQELIDLSVRLAMEAKEKDAAG